MKDLCKGGEEIEFGQKRCTFSLKFSSKDNMKFEAAVQIQDGENVLFDSISEKVTSSSLSETNPKKFFYYLFESK